MKELGMGSEATYKEVGNQFRNFYNLIQGDCLDVLPNIKEKSVDLIIVDPPYNIGIDSWDKIDDYLNWCKRWVLECVRILKETGSLYIFHNQMPFIARLVMWIEKNTSLVFKSMITWERYATNKQYYGRNILMRINQAKMRNYPLSCEYILFYTLQDGTELSKIKSLSVNPIREYIRTEILRAKGKISLKEVNEALETATTGGGVASSILTRNKSFPSMITKEHYLKLQNWLNDGEEGKYLKRNYEYLRQQYENLRRKHERLRYTFNHQKDVVRTWLFCPAEKHGHLTPKPIPLIENILKHSTNKDDVVVDCFAGSGSTIFACQNLGRSCTGIEINPNYCEIVKKRCFGRTFLNRDVEYNFKIFGGEVKG